MTTEQNFVVICDGVSWFKKAQGRPKKPAGMLRKNHIRELWRNASQTYYEKNKEEICVKARKKRSG